MCKEQKDFIHILEEVAEMKIETTDKKEKKSTKKPVNLVEPVEKMKKRFQNLDKDEKEKLLEGSRLMFEDSAGAADQCQTTAALIISTLAAIISAFSLSVSAANMASETDVPIYFGAIIFIVLIGIASIYPIIRIHRRLRIADNYRNACLALIALSGNYKDGETEGK